MIILTQHILDRLKERGATEADVIMAIEKGETFPAKYNRTGFRINLLFNSEWNGKFYSAKQIEIYAVKEIEDWVAITVIVKYF